MKWIGIMFVLMMMAIPMVAAADFDTELSAADKAAFDEILEPVMKVYNLVKYIASVIAVVVALFAGITYMLSGSDPRKRDQAKNMAMYVIIGLFVIWAAPLVVNYIIG